MHPEHMETAVSTAAALGQRVAIFGETLEPVQKVCRDLEEILPEGYRATVRRLNGAHSITFEESGGWIRFYSLRSGGGFRGESVDRVFVPVGTSPEKLVGIVPAMATSRAGVLTGY